MFYRVFIIVLGVILLASCTEQKVEVIPAFYYWKNKARKLSLAEQQALTTLGTKKLYVKFFEVESDADIDVIPTAKTSLKLETAQSEIEIIPTIFVRNEIFKQLTEPRLDSLAGQILKLVDKYYKEKYAVIAANYQELQIDCDWTSTTKEKYFYLLKRLKERSKKKLSCTLRLYPYKYPDKMGLPPVDRAMLMCYNLIGPLENKHKNSILDLKELKPYLVANKPYKIPLDIALPIFSWMQVYQYNRFVGLLRVSNTHFDDFLQKVDGLWSVVKKDTVIGNTYLRIGDKIKYEAVDSTILNEAISVLKKSLALKGTTTIALFHLDENNLNNYKHETLHHFYNTFAD
mgnify:CR=1 FL=1